MKTATVTGPLERIVGRLRACAECEQAPLGPLLTDAANEIERLMEALRAAEHRILFGDWPSSYGYEAMRGAMASMPQQFTAAELREAERGMNAWNAMTKTQRATALEAAKTACPAEAMRNLGYRLPPNARLSGHGPKEPK